MIDHSYHRNVQANDNTEIGVRVSSPYAFGFTSTPIKITIPEGWSPYATAYLTPEQTRECIEAMQEALYAYEMLASQYTL